MKKWLSFLLISALYLCSVGALSEQSAFYSQCKGYELCDLWQMYYGESLADYSANGFTPCDNNCDEVGGVAIGGYADFLISDSYIGYRNNDGAKTLLTEMIYFDSSLDPAFDEILQTYPYNDVQLLDSQLFGWADRYGEPCIEQEFYYFFVTIYEIDTIHTYDLLVKCRSEMDGGESIECAVLYEEFLDYEGAHPKCFVPVSTNMSLQVVRCNEWVSLRAEPDVNSERLAMVPLGAAFENADYYGGDFVYGCYDCQFGYILADYLALG